MQQPVTPNLGRPVRPRHTPRGLPLIIGLACLLAAGCGPDPNPGTGQPSKPFTGISLMVLCPDAAFAPALTPAAESWATRTGAKVTVKTEAMTPGDTADVGILTAGEFGAWADRGELAPVPV